MIKLGNQFRHIGTGAIYNVDKIIDKQYLQMEIVANNEDKENLTFTKQTIMELIKYKILIPIVNFDKELDTL